MKQICIDCWKICEDYHNVKKVLLDKSYDVIEFVCFPCMDIRLKKEGLERPKSVFQIGGVN
jgi:hypothetical protein